METPSDTMVLAISLNEVSGQVSALLKLCPIASDVVLDIVVRTWELATIDPVEYYDELRSIVYDELHCQENLGRLRGATNAGAMSRGSALDSLADYAFNYAHQLLQLLRPHLDKTIGEYRQAGTYEYTIQHINYVIPTLIVRLLRSDRVLDYYRNLGEQR